MTNVDFRKIKVLKKATRLARKYQKIIDKSFLIVYERGFFEFMFLKKNFPHLCGLELRNISAKNFYENAISKKLSINDIDFDKSHSYESIDDKMKSLEKCIEMFSKKFYILIPFKTNSATYIFAASNENLALCINKDKETNYNVPFSIRDESMEKIMRNERFENKYEVDYVFIKQKDENIYQQIYSKPKKKQK